MSVDAQQSNSPSYMELETIQETKPSVASRMKLPIVSITIGKQKIRCLIDTGSTTSILKSNILKEQFPEDL